MQNRKVLFVDDEADIRTIARLSLHNVGKWEVALAASGAEALALAIEGQPDVILLDVMMPGMDGPTTLEKLKESPETEGIPVIFMTAKVQKLERERYLALGAVGVIPKPFDPMTLSEQVRKILS